MSEQKLSGRFRSGHMVSLFQFMKL